MPVKFEVEGMERTARAMRNLTPDVDRNLHRAIDLTTQSVWRNARKAMRGAKSGSEIDGHRASAPGEAPAIDTGTLYRSIYRKVRRLFGEVGSYDPKALWLEFGAKRSGAGGVLRARPWLRPAERGERRRWNRRVRKALRDAGRKAQRTAGR